MSTELRLTTPEVRDSIVRTTGRQYSIQRTRRVIDALETEGVIDVQRVGLYRTVVASDVPRIADELRARGRAEAVANV